MDDRYDPDLAVAGGVDDAPAMYEDLAEIGRTIGEPAALAGLVGEQLDAGEEAARDGGGGGRGVGGDVVEDVAEVLPGARRPDQPSSHLANSALTSSCGIPSPA